MRILVYGAGNIGCLYAGLLNEAGQDVSILARGKRLASIRGQGIRLEDAVTGKKTTAPVRAVAHLEPDDAYDVVLVVLPKNHVSEVLPVLRDNRRTPTVVFFGNNAAGPEKMIEAVGRERVLFGFPGAAATGDDYGIRYLILSAREQATTIGELDGTSSVRVEAIADALEAAGFSVSICSDMTAWLQTHAAEICPTANALYMAGADINRLLRTRDAILLMLRAVREGHSVLSALGVPITPRKHAVFRWLPEPLLLFLGRKMLESDGMDIKIGHALGARNEMRTLAEEFQELVRKSGVPSPSIDALNRYLDPRTEPVPDRSSEIPVHWSPVWLALWLVVGLPVALAVLWSLLT